jgi:hypothetical protein
MGNEQIYKFCNCTGESKEANKSQERVFLENGKLAKNDDEGSMHIKFRSYNLSSAQNSIMDKSDKSDMGTSKSKKNPFIFEEDCKTDRSNTPNSPTPITKRIDLGEGNYYEGFIMNKKYHGKGVLLIGNTMYRGEFAEGNKQGKGEIIDIETDKLLFTGEFHNDDKEGFGKKLNI